MTIRKRTALVLLAACIVAVVVVYFAIQGILTAHTAALEEERANQDLELASNALSQDVASVEMIVRDRASRDDTYQFVQDGNTEYVASNLETAILANLRINFAVFVDSAGQIAYSKSVDLSSETETSLPLGLDQYATGAGLLAKHTNETSSVAGILFLPEHLAFVASRPILPSQNEGPIMGSLVMGRYLNSEELQRLSELTSLSLELYRVDEADIPADFQVARSSLSDERTSLVRILDGNTVAAYMLVNEIQGSPAFVLGIDQPREISAQDRQSALYILYLLLGLGTLFSLVLFFGVDMAVLSRLRRLGTSVETVDASRDLSERVSVGGKDELTAVAEVFNRNLASLEQSQRDLSESEARNRAIVEAIPDLVFRIDREGTITETRRAQKVAWATEEHDSPDKSDEIMNLIQTQIRDMVMPHLAKALESRQMQAFGFQVTVDGRESQHEARVIANSDNDGLVMVRDVTAQMHEHEERQNSLLLSELHSRVKNLRQTLRSAPPGRREPATEDSPLRQGSASVPSLLNTTDAGTNSSPVQLEPVGTTSQRE